MNENIIRKKRSNKFIKMINILIIIAFVIVVVFMGRIAIFQTVGGTNLQEFQANRMVEEEVLYAERGGIYDVNGVPIAQTVPTYNMYAIIDESYSKDQQPDEAKLHVTDPMKVANAVAPLINMDVQLMYDILTQSGFQVEFAPYGNGLSQTEKDRIASLELEGIYFNEHDSRSYSQGAFAAHIVGYATYNQETKHLEGAMGLEATLNDKWLTGKDGYYRYQTNVHGQKIKEAPEEYFAAENGSNVYLTIDSFIQRRIESTLSSLQETHQPAWAVVAVADPKTGAILGVGQTPTFDPNTLNNLDGNYLNYFTEAEYEVGSIMKTITYASAIDTGRYNGQEAVYSGAVTIDDWTISDWNGSGWGTIVNDQGLFYSSNTAIANIVQNTLTTEEQREYLKAFGFGQTTTLEMTNQATGTFNLDSTIARVTTGYGQGTTATVAQMLQAYNAIANGGKMMELHLVDRIEDSSGNLQYQHEERVVSEPISTETANYVMNLLTDSVNGDGAYSSRFKMKSATMAGKTGTADVVDTETGQYLPSYDTNYIYSFAGVAPAEDPQFVIITSIALPQVSPTTATSTVINSLSDDINSYLNMTNKYGNSQTTVQQDETTGITTIDLFPSFLNRRREDVIGYMSVVAPEMVVFVGNGDTIINQSIEPYTQYTSTQRVILQTNSTEIALPNFSGWSRKDVQTYALYAGIEVIYEGDGYVIEQSVLEGEIITDENRIITIKLST